MYLQSLFDPLPPTPITNFHNLLFRPPGYEDIPDHVMHIDAISGQKRTRFEFLERLYDGATALGAPKNAGGQGFTSKDMVAILSDNCLDYLVLIHSLFVITTPCALLSAYATPRELAHSLSKSKATHIFVHAALYSRLLPVAREHGLSADRIYILEGRTNMTPSPPSFGQLIQNVRVNKIPREPIRPAQIDTLAYLIFSSGTSGLPKAVMISHGNLNFSHVQGAMITLEYAKIMDPPPDPDVVPVIISFLPINHSYGLHYTCIRGAMRPATHIILPRWDLDLVLDLIPKYRVSVLPTVPSIIHQLVHSPKFQKTDLSSITAIGTGAAYLPPKLGEKFMKLIPQSASFSQGYGLSEATLSAIVKPSPGLLDGRAEDTPDATGILCPGMDAMILRPDGTHCLPNEPGDLYVKGGNVALGYWDNPEATKETFLADGWLRTGDRFKANSNSTFWFEDRAKDTLKVSGLQVSPAEIEDVLLAEPTGLINDAAVAGVQTPGARTSDDRSPRAWVVLSERGQRLSEQQVRAALEHWAKTNLSKYKWLRGGIQFVREIPKNSTGKILRRVLQEQYASEMSSRPKL